MHPYMAYQYCSFTQLNGYITDQKVMHWHTWKCTVAFEPGVPQAKQHNMQASGWSICGHMAGVCNSNDLARRGCAAAWMPNKQHKRRASTCSSCKLLKMSQ